MNTNEKDNIKFTLRDDDGSQNKTECEIVVSRSFFDAVLLNLFIARDSFKNDKIHLTNREIEVLRYIAGGNDNGAIAKHMNISVHTAKMYVKKIFEKLEVKDRTQAAVKAVKYGLIDIYSQEDTDEKYSLERKLPRHTLISAK